MKKDIINDFGYAMSSRDLLYNIVPGADILYSHLDIW